MSFFSENSFDRLLTKRMFQTDTLKFRLSNVKNLSFKLTANQHMDSISLNTQTSIYWLVIVNTWCLNSSSVVVIECVGHILSELRLLSSSTVLVILCKKKKKTCFLQCFPERRHMIRSRNASGYNRCSQTDVCGNDHRFKSKIHREKSESSLKKKKNHQLSVKKSTTPNTATKHTSEVQSSFLWGCRRQSGWEKLALP